MDPGPLVAGQLGVAGDHRRLGHRGDPVEAEGGADGALVHDAFTGQRAVLLVQRQHAAAQALVLQGLAQHAGALHGLAVVAESERPLLSQLGHLGELLALQPAGDAATKPTGMRASRAAASRSERSSGAESSTGSVLGIAITPQ